MAAAGLGRSERALRLGAAAASIWEETGAVIEVGFWVGLLDKWFSQARESLPPAEASRAWEDGRELSFERAVEEALEPTT